MPATASVVRERILLSIHALADRLLLLVARLTWQLASECVKEHSRTLAHDNSTSLEVSRHVRLACIERALLGLVLGLRASGRLRRDLEEVPQNLGCELQCPPRRLLIDVGCVRSYSLKDASRVLVVRA